MILQVHVPVSVFRSQLLKTRLPLDTPRKHFPVSHGGKTSIPPLCCHPSQRSFLTVKKRLTFKPQHKTDNVPKDYDLIYENPMSNIIRPSRVTASCAGMLTCVCTVGASIVHFDTMGSLDRGIMAVLAVVSLISVAVVNILCKRYLSRIYYHTNSDKFIGVFHGLSSRLKKLVYTRQDVQLLKPSKKEYSKCIVKIHGNAYSLRSQDFALPKYYNWHSGKDR